jgi:hypothetical protein
MHILFTMTRNDSPALTSFGGVRTNFSQSGIAPPDSKKNHGTSLVGLDRGSFTRIRPCGYLALPSTVTILN